MKPGVSTIVNFGFNLIVMYEAVVLLEKIILKTKEKLIYVYVGQWPNMKKLVILFPHIQYIILMNLH